MRAAFDHHEKDGFNALSNSAYGFVVICGNFSEVFGFFLVTPACKKLGFYLPRFFHFFTSKIVSWIKKKSLTSGFSEIEKK